jgi:hypothetical protein
LPPIEKRFLLGEWELSRTRREAETVTIACGTESSNPSCSSSESSANRATSVFRTDVEGHQKNGSRVRLWKRELQKLANELSLDIVVSHLPPGTSKWNKIEHRLFSFISQNWRAQPLVSYRVIVELISATTTKTGLTVRCELDTGLYPSGIVVSDAEIAALNIRRAEFHGEWNYTISPNTYPPNCAFIS